MNRRDEIEMPNLPCPNCGHGTKPDLDKPIPEEMKPELLKRYTQEFVDNLITWDCENCNWHWLTGGRREQA